MVNYNTPENNKSLVTKTRRAVTKKVVKCTYETSIGDFVWDEESGYLDINEIPEELTTSEMLDLIAIFKEILKDLEVEDLDK